MSVNYVRCSSVTACCYAKQDFFNMCHSHSHEIIPIPISSTKDSFILMGIPISMHTSVVDKGCYKLTTKETTVFCER